MPARAATAPAPTRRERRKREVHTRIVQAAVTCFDRRGVDGTRVDDICAAADVAQKTFFNHFPTKQHVVAEIAAAFVTQLLGILDEARQTAGSTRARLERFFARVAAETERAGPMHRALVLEVIRLIQHEGAGTEPSRRLHASVGALLRDGVRAGDVTRAHPTQVLTEVVVGAFYAVMLNWLSIDGYPIRARALGAARFLGDALANDRARTR